MTGYVVSAFYKFFPVSDQKNLRDRLLDALRPLNAKGSILLASEGINGTVAAPPDNIRAVMESIRTLAGLAELEHKLSNAADMPFKRLKVRLKTEIVKMGVPGVDPNKAVGTYVEPQDWNRLISDPDVVLIDTRNAYEFSIGTFKGAVDPKTESFTAFPAFVQQHFKNNRSAKVAMFCTGGIRCEKASSYMRMMGFENVYHLKGGILKYLEAIPREESLWQGDCFVFDERVAVTHGLAQSDVSMCFGCLEPVTAQDRASPLYEEGVCCPRCSANLTDAQRKSNRERQKQFMLAKKRGSRHLGPQD